MDIKTETFPTGPLGCNCTLIYSESTRECVAVDPGQDAAAFLQEIQQRNLKVIKLIHTHAHFDHIGGACEISKETQAPIYLHKNDEQLYQSLPEQGQFFGFAFQRPEKIDYFLEDEMDVDERISLQTLWTPGHTQGSVCFYTEYFEYPLLFSGDTLFRQSVGRTDLPGGDTDQLFRSLKNRLLVLPEETQVITGHGPCTTLRDEKKDNPYL